MLTYKPRKMSEKDATIIIERRHPYGLFFLKEGNEIGRASCRERV